MATLRYFAADGSAAILAGLSPASSLLVSLMKAGAPIRHDCGGKALCGTCRIEVAGRDGLSPIRQQERERLSALGLALAGDIRLACQTYSTRDNEAHGLVPLTKEGQP
ncbi:MAG: 2Fe-2S iron-sulfur cluster-binding protein [Spirochaetota bacterium]